MGEEGLELELDVGIVACLSQHRVSSFKCIAAKQRLSHVLRMYFLKDFIPLPSSVRVFV